MAKQRQRPRLPAGLREARHGRVVWGRRAERNAQALEALRALGAPRVHSETVDVSDVRAVEAAFAATLRVMGRVDCVFANAGFHQRAESSRT
jgi:NAD(P)-dependent dehydrogenase (short-subunit alcohol dehydrogenase family)